MTDFHDWLKEGDPIASEPPLSDADVQRMRQVVVAASDERRPFFADLARASWAAATVMVALTIAAGVQQWFTPQSETRSADVRTASTVAAPAPGARRQVQLIAPGGTRVIWIFNADFQQ
jgi:hypothetical protein